MKNIPSLDIQIKTERITTNGTLLRAYIKALENNYSMLVLEDDDLWPDYVADIVSDLKGLGISKVGLVCSSSALRNVLWEFHKAGASVTMGVIDMSRPSYWMSSVEPGFIITLEPSTPFIQPDTSVNTDTPLSDFPNAFHLFN